MMTRQNGYADGSRKRRHSADPAKRRFYAEHRSAANTESTAGTPQVAPEGPRQETHSSPRPGQEAVTGDPVDSEKTQNQGS